jgi:hypothetical protein
MEQSGYSLQPHPHAGSSLADFSTLKMEEIYYSETSVHTGSTWRHVPEDGILQMKLQINLLVCLLQTEVGLGRFGRG